MGGLARRAVVSGILALPGAAFAAPGRAFGERLCEAAERQVGVTRNYDPAYHRIAYPGGDLPRGTGVCADVPVRAARDALGLDLQKLVHEDMAAHFAAYPHRWGLAEADANIDHRRVPNLETFWRRQGAAVWEAGARENGPVFGGGALLPGDFITWRLGGRMPHVGVVIHPFLTQRFVHNIGGGVVRSSLLEMGAHRAVGHYRWPKGSVA